MIPCKSMQHHRKPCPGLYATMLPKKHLHFFGQTSDQTVPPTRFTVFHRLREWLKLKMFQFCQLATGFTLACLWASALVLLYLDFIKLDAIFSKLLVLSSLRLVSCMQWLYVLFNTVEGRSGAGSLPSTVGGNGFFSVSGKSRLRLTTFNQLRTMSHLG